MPTVRWESAADDVTALAPTILRQYVEQQVAWTGVPRDVVEALASAAFAHLLPDGTLLPGHAIHHLLDDDGERVGRIWLGPHPQEPGVAHLYDLHLEEGHRGRGLGRAAIERAHAWAAEAGYTDVVLHVFAANRVAVRLYESLGYATTDLVMRRSLRTGPSPGLMTLTS